MEQGTTTPQIGCRCYRVAALSLAVGLALLSACGGAGNSSSLPTISPEVSNAPLASRQFERYVTAVARVLASASQKKGPQLSFNPARQAQWSRFRVAIVWGLREETQIRSQLGAIRPPPFLAAAHARLLAAHDQNLLALSLLYDSVSHRVPYHKWQALYHLHSRLALQALRQWDAAVLIGARERHCKLPSALARIMAVPS